jgi:hypothetical protein
VRTTGTWRPFRSARRGLTGRGGRQPPNQIVEVELDKVDGEGHELRTLRHEEEVPVSLLRAERAVGPGALPLQRATRREPTSSGPGSDPADVAVTRPVAGATSRSSPCLDSCGPSPPSSPCVALAARRWPWRGPWPGPQPPGWLSGEHGSRGSSPQRSAPSPLSPCCGALGFARAAGRCGPARTSVTRRDDAIVALATGHKRRSRMVCSAETTGTMGLMAVIHVRRFIPDHLVSEGLRLDHAQRTVAKRGLGVMSGCA